MVASSWSALSQCSKFTEPPFQRIWTCSFNVQANHTLSYLSSPVASRYLMFFVLKFITGWAKWGGRHSPSNEIFSHSDRVWNKHPHEDLNLGPNPNFSYCWLEVRCSCNCHLGISRFMNVAAFFDWVICRSNWNTPVPGVWPLEHIRPVLQRNWYIQDYLWINQIYFTPNNILSPCPTIMFDPVLHPSGFICCTSFSWLQHLVCVPRGLWRDEWRDHPSPTTHHVVEGCLFHSIR